MVHNVRKEALVVHEKRDSKMIFFLGFLGQMVWISICLMLIGLWFLGLDWRYSR